MLLRPWSLARFAPRRAACTRPGLLQQRGAPCGGEALDRVAEGGARNGGAVLEQEPLQPDRIGLAGLAEQPPARLVDQVLPIAEQRGLRPDASQLPNIVCAVSNRNE